MKKFDFNSPKRDLNYWGCSDFLGQLSDEIRNYPDSCFAQNAVAWYNTAYAEDEFRDCRYQVAINEELCPLSNPESEEELLDLLFNSALTDIPSTLTTYLVNKALEQGQEEGKKFINDIRKNLTKTFNEAA